MDCGILTLVVSVPHTRLSEMLFKTCRAAQGVLTVPQDWRGSAFPWKEWVLKEREEVREEESEEVREKTREEEREKVKEGERAWLATCHPPPEFYLIHIPLERGRACPRAPPLKTPPGNGITTGIP